jgi:hypothetical protein
MKNQQAKTASASAKAETVVKSQNGTLQNLGDILSDIPEGKMLDGKSGVNEKRSRQASPDAGEEESNEVHDETDLEENEEVAAGDSSEEEGDGEEVDGDGKEDETAEEGEEGEAAESDETEDAEGDETEDEADAASKDAENADEEEEIDGIPRKEWPKSFVKRLGKVVAKSKTLEEENATLKERLNEVQHAGIEVGPRSDDPMAGIFSEGDLEKQVQSALRVKAWAAKNPNGGKVKQGDGEIEIPAEQVAENAAAADAVLMHYAPKRREWLKKNAEYSVEARKAFPELYKNTTREYQEAVSVMRALPEITRRPDYAMILGDYIAGRKLRLNKAKAPVAVGKKLVPKPKTIPAPPKISGGGVKMKAKEQQRRGSIRKIAESKGSYDSIDAAIEAMI